MGTLADEPIEYRRQQYNEKNDVLRAFGEEVSPATMYEDIFGDLDLLMPIVTIDETATKHLTRMSVSEAIDFANGRNDMLMGCCTYYNEFISKKTTRDIYAFVIDMDNVYSGVLQNALRARWATASGDPLPLPTYVVNSGTGLHLYFVLQRPLPHYRRNAVAIDSIYRKLAELQTSQRVYLRKQIQWYGQNFRIAGGCGKDQFVNTAFRIGERWDIHDLAIACGLPELKFYYYGEWPSAIRKPHSETAKKKKKSSGWHTNRAFYDYSVRMCRNRTKEGHRYNSMCAITCIGYKCGISKDEIRKDLVSLLPDYNQDCVRKIQEREIDSALKMYNIRAMETPRSRLEDWQGWQYAPVKRNGRTRQKHLVVARAMKVVKKTLGEPMNEGRPSYENIIRDWLTLHPDGTGVQCMADTGVSRPTVYKWLPILRREKSDHENS